VGLVQSLQRREGQTDNLLIIAACRKGRQIPPSRGVVLPED